MSNPGFFARHGHKAVPLVILLGLALAAFIYRDALIAWFKPLANGAEQTSAESMGHDGGSGATSQPSEAPAALAYAFPEPSQARLAAAFEAYEVIRSALSHDTVEGVPEAAARLREELSAAGEGLESAPHAVHELLATAAAAAEAVGTAADLEAARSQFGELSRGLIGLGGADPRVREGWHVFLCPMATGYPRWLQQPEQLENPFYGSEMLSCGEPSEWGEETDSAAPASRPQATSQPHEGHAQPPDLGEGEGNDDEIAFYTCSMHPSIRAHEPGNCPICGMQLTPVTYGEQRSGAVRVDAVRRQRIGVRTGVVERRALSRQIRAVGRVTYDESRLEDVTLRVDGWIERLRVETTGQEVERGDVLFELYSPDLYAAELELLVARRSGVGGDGHLLEASRQRLELMGMSGRQIEALEERGEVTERISIRSPASGFVIEKDVVEGAFVMAGERIYRIAGLDVVWVEAEVYEPDLPHIEVGQTAAITFPTLPGPFEGRVSYIYPYLQPETRTGRIRIELPNPDLALRADMYADVHISVDLGERLVVPSSAIIYTGPRRLVFVVVDPEEGLMVPRQVEVGLRSGEVFEVVSGLEPGEVVVTSGNYLIAAESRLRGATEYWGGSEGGGGAGGGGGHAGH